MNTLLVVMILTGRAWTPVYVVEHPTEQACQVAAKAGTDAGVFGNRKAVCVPKLQTVKP